MRKYSALVKSLITGFTEKWFEKINRRHNQRVNELSQAIAREKICGI